MWSTSGFFGTLCLAIALSAVGPVSAQPTCLSESIFPKKRKIYNASEWSMLSVPIGDALVQMPIGLCQMNWASAMFVPQVFIILASEVLGYNATITLTTDSSMTCAWSTGACSDPGKFTQGAEAAGCGAEINDRHFAFETWGGGNLVNMREMEKQLKELAPEMLGNMGYEGAESVYVLAGSYEQAWNNSGLALQFYTSWNADWNRPSDYFDGISSINRSDLLDCQAQMLQKETLSEAEMGFYKQYTGDSGGVYLNSDGEYEAQCDGPWWYSPTCRANPANCVPVVSVGNGYCVESMMQAAAAHKMPLAIATTKSWGTWEAVVKASKPLFYWWTPDVTFLELKPVEVQLPTYDSLAWGKGDKRTGPSKTELFKWANRRMRNIAPDAVDLAQRMQFSLAGDSGIDAALLRKKNLGSEWSDVACWWVQNSYDVWKNWIRDPTECSPGQGITDAGEKFLLSKNASMPGGGTPTSCQFCGSGFKSQEVKDSDGSYIFVCAMCEEGTYQEGAGATNCEGCPAGTFSNAEGVTACKSCRKGFFSPDIGAQTCMKCDGEETTAGPGADSWNWCVCPEGTYKVNDKCSACPGGMVCDEGSDLNCLPEYALPPQANSSKCKQDQDNRIFPVSAENHMTLISDPVGAYRCSTPDACPGGAPQTCADGRIGLTCQECEANMKPVKDSGMCTACDGPADLAVVFFCMLLAFAAVVIYFATNGATPMPPTPRLCLTSCTSLGLTSVQILGVVSLLSVNYPEAVKAAFSMVQWSTLDLSGSLWVTWCSNQHSPQFKFVCTVCVFPFICAVLGVLAVVGKQIPDKVPIKPQKAANSAGAFLMGAFITMTSVAMTPMSCFLHPNGERSVTAYSQVLCWTGGHWPLFFLGLLLLLFALLFFAGIVYIVLQAPAVQKKKGIGNFFTTYRFLFNLFRTDKWWWSLVVIPRGLSLSLVRVVAPDSPNIQVLAMIVIIALYTCLIGTVRPWKVPLLNLLDSIVGLLMTVCLGSASAFMPMPTNPEGIYSLMIVAVSVILAITGGAWVLAAIFVLLEIRSGNRPPMGEETSAGVCQVFLMREIKYTELSRVLIQAFTEMSHMTTDTFAADMKRWQIYDVNLMTDLLQVINSNALVQQSAVTQVPMARLRSANSSMSLMNSAASQQKSTAEDTGNGEARTRITEDTGNGEARTRITEDIVAVCYEDIMEEI